MKKSVALLVAISVLAGAMAGCGNTDKTVETNQTAEYEGVKIRLVAKADGTVFGLAEELGYLEEEFAKDGIEVEVTVIEGGPAFIDAVATDQVDFGIFGDQPIISAYANGKPIKVVGIAADDTASYQLVATDASGIEAGADLKGKRIAYSAGTTTEKIIKQILEAEGLTEQDVELVNVSGVNELTLLESGDIDALIYSQHSGTIIDYDGYHKVADYSEYGRSVHVIAANTKFLEEYPELAARVLQVLDRTQDWMMENREDAVQMIQENGQYTEAQAELVFDGEIWEISYTGDDAAVLNKTAQFLYDIDAIDHEVTADEIVDTSYLKEAGLLE